MIRKLLCDEPWQLIIPLQVYHELGKRGRCCGCFPHLVDIIVKTSEQFHLEMEADEKKIVNFIEKLKEKHQQCETARMLARQKIDKPKVA